MPFIRRLCLISLLGTLPATVLQAQGGVGDTIPAISALGTAHVKVTPDRATVQISVQTRGETAASTARENANKQSAVLKALQKLGIPDKQISTSNYNVEPQYRYVQNQEPILTGYLVTNTVVADVHDIAQVGAVIDAALGAGANMISSLDFYASNTAVVRRQAIAAGVENARSEAEAAAKAAGGTLGNVLGIDIEGETGSGPRPMYAKVLSATDGAAPTPIVPGEQTLTVRVSTRWRFVPNGGK